MKKKSHMRPMHWLFACSLGLLACDSREDRRQVEEATSENTRTRQHTRRDAPETAGTPSGASTEEPKEPSVPAQSTDESIAEWAWSMMGTRPEMVDKAIRELPADSPQRQELIRAYAAELLKNGPDAAIAWAATLGDQASILAAHEAVAMALPAEEIDRSVKLLLNPQRITSQGFDNSSTALLQRWISTKPQDAARWILALPTGPSREAGVGQLASNWVQGDPAGAFQWLSAQPSRPLRQELGQAMALTLAEMPDFIRDNALQSATPTTRQQLEDEVHKLLPPPGDSEAPADEEVPDEMQDGE